MRRRWFVAILIWSLSGSLAGADSRPSAAEQPTRATDVAGEVFGKPVSAEEFGYCYKTVSLLTRERDEPKSDEAMRAAAWRHVILVREADRLGIRMERAELDQALERLVAERGGVYGGPAYRQWVATTIGDDVATFEQRVEELLRVNRLVRSQSSAEQPVSEDAVAQRYMDEHTALELEFVTFDSTELAAAFIERMRQEPAIWKPLFDERRQLKGQRGASWINLMTLSALKELWQIPANDLALLLDSAEGDLRVVKMIYGPAAVRLLRRHRRSFDELDQASREAYRGQLMSHQQQQAAETYIQTVVDKAGLRDFTTR